MSNPDYIPRKDEDFQIWQTNFCIQINVGGRATRFGIPTEKLTALQDLQGLWVDAFQLASQPSTRTSLIVEQKKRARADYESYLRILVRQHVANNEQTTYADRVALGLPVYKTTRTPAPVPATYPDYSIDTSVIRQLSIHFRDQNKTGKAKPVRVHGAEILWALRDTPPTTINDLTRSGFDTNSPFTLTFDENQRGKTVYFCLRWENTRGEKGPWSEIVSAIVP